VLLIIVAVALLIAEVKVTSYGLLSVAGILAMLLGGMMLVDAPIPEMRISLSTLLPAVAVMSAWALILVRLVVISQRRRATTGRAGMVGLQGVAKTELAPGGTVLVAGELWKARADEAIAAGEEVTVESVEGLTLRVRKGA
jgi:membrane-bound serine protease (ClpP class)